MPAHQEHFLELFLSQYCIQMTSHFYTAAFKAFTNMNSYWAAEFLWDAYMIDEGQ